MSGLGVGLAAAQVATDTNTEPFWDGGSVVALIAAIIALFGTVFTIVRQQQIATEQRTHEANILAITQAFTKRQQRIEHRERQLSELYGPLQTYRRMATALRRSLPPHPWRLVANIPQVQAEKGLSALVTAILDINEATEKLLVNKAGLIEGAAPGSFSEFMHHSRLLRAAWANKGELVPEGAAGTRVSEVPYPDQFGRDVDDGYATAHAELQRLRQGEP